MKTDFLVFTNLNKIYIKPHPHCAGTICLTNQNGTAKSTDVDFLSERVIRQNIVNWHARQNPKTDGPDQTTLSRPVGFEWFFQLGR